MAFEDVDMDLESDGEEAGPPPEESSNRPFYIVAGILGGLFLLTLICLVAFVLLRGPLTAMLGGNGTQNPATQAAIINEQNTQIAFGVTQTEAATAWTATPGPTRPATNTPVAQATATSTRVVAVATTPASNAARTATIAALLTQSAGRATTTPATATMVAGGPTATALPDSGFADNVGAPGLLALGLLLVGVVFLARRLRTAH
jgi:hypothetical protein